MSAFLSSLTRLSPHIFPKPVLFTRNISANTKLDFYASPCLMAEPLKKKKKLDPAVIKAREERKKKKIEKQIRRLQKNARQLKSMEECQVSLQLLDEKKHRMRQLPAVPAQVLEQRAIAEKRWAAWRRNEHLRDVQMLDKIAYSQQKALDELRSESEELHREAIQIDFRLLPYKSQGPLETPPIKHYESPDGDYVDVTKKWE